METVVIEGLVDGQADAAESVHFHRVIAEIVEDVIVREIGHHLIEQHHVPVGHPTASHVVAIQSHLLVRTGPAALQEQRLSYVVVGKDVVVDDGLERRGYAVRV